MVGLAGGVISYCGTLVRTGTSITISKGCGVGLLLMSVTIEHSVVLLEALVDVIGQSVLISLLISARKLLLLLFISLILLLISARPKAVVATCH